MALNVNAVFADNPEGGCWPRGENKLLTVRKWEKKEMGICVGHLATLLHKYYLHDSHPALKKLVGLNWCPATTFKGSYYACNVSVCEGCVIPYQEWSRLLILLGLMLLLPIWNGIQWPMDVTGWVWAEPGCASQQLQEWLLMFMGCGRLISYQLGFWQFNK